MTGFSTGSPFKRARTSKKIFAMLFSFGGTAPPRKAASTTEPNGGG